MDIRRIQPINWFEVLLLCIAIPLLFFCLPSCIVACIMHFAFGTIWTKALGIGAVFVAVSLGFIAWLGDRWK